MISREQAQALIDKYITTPWLKLHMRESELIMRKIAKHLTQDQDIWGIAGLLHDLDFDYVEKDPKRHVIEFDMLLRKENLTIGEDIPVEMYHAIKAHYEENPDIQERRESDLDYALSACETISGFLVACALVQPDKKIASVDLESVVKKLKKKEFARAVNRKNIYDIEKIGISIETFILLSLEVLQENAKELGL